MHIQGLKFFKFQICWNKMLGKLLHPTHILILFLFINLLPQLGTKKHALWQKTPPSRGYIETPWFPYCFISRPFRGRGVTCVRCLSITWGIGHSVDAVPPWRMVAHGGLPHQNSGYLRCISHDTNYPVCSGWQSKNPLQKKWKDSFEPT